MVKNIYRYIVRWRSNIVRPNRLLLKPNQIQWDGWQAIPSVRCGLRIGECTVCSDDETGLAHYVGRCSGVSGYIPSDNSYGIAGFEARWYGGGVSHRVVLASGGICWSISDLVTRPRSIKSFSTATVQRS